MHYISNQKLQDLSILENSEEEGGIQCERPWQGSVRSGTSCWLLQARWVTGDLPRAAASPFTAATRCGWGMRKCAPLSQDHWLRKEGGCLGCLLVKGQ